MAVVLKWGLVACILLLCMIQIVRERLYEIRQGGVVGLLC
jgi:hypothetical protein